MAEASTPQTNIKIDPSNTVFKGFVKSGKNRESKVLIEEAREKDGENRVRTPSDQKSSCVALISPLLSDSLETQSCCVPWQCISILYYLHIICNYISFTIKDYLQFRAHSRVLSVYSNFRMPGYALDIFTHLSNNGSSTPFL